MFRGIKIYINYRDHQPPHFHASYGDYECSININDIELINGEVRIYEMKDSLFGVFEILKNISKFKEVFIDEHGNVAWDRENNIDSNIHWNNRIDICKDAIYLESKLVSSQSQIP